jgi:hypothetical protein
MMLSMPVYQVKYHGEQDWQDISEIELLQKLLETHEQVTPAIQLLIEGNQLLTAAAVYKLKDNRKDKLSI